MSFLLPSVEKKSYTKVKGLDAKEWSFAVRFRTETEESIDKCYQVCYNVHITKK